MSNPIDQIDAMIRDWEAWHSGDIPYQDQLDLQRTMLMREPATLRALKMACETLEKEAAYQDQLRENMMGWSSAASDALAKIAKELGNVEESND